MIPTPWRLAAHARVLGTFGLVYVLPALGLLVLLPVLARNADLEQWYSFGVGQSIGAIAALVITYGWSLEGPIAVAHAAPKDVGAIYAQSIADRIAVSAVAIPIALVVAFFMTHEQDPVLGMLSVASAASGGLTITWLSIGLGAPGLSLRFEAIPRLFAALASAAFIGVGAPIATFPGLTLVLALVGFVGGTRSIVSRTDVESWSALVRQTPASLRGRSWAATTEFVAGIYTVGAVAVVATSATVTTTAVFNSGDRLTRFALVSVVSLTSLLQPWVLRGSAVTRQARTRVGVMLHAGLGVVGGGLLALCGPSASRVLFGADLGVSRSTTVWFGLAFALISVSSSLARLVLAPAGHARILSLTTLLGVLIGAPLMAYGGSHGGPDSAAAGLALGELAVVLAQTVAVVICGLGHHVGVSPSRERTLTRGRGGSKP